MAGAKYFSVLDLSSSFWQISLDEKHRGMTASLQQGTQYHFTRAPLGHCTSSAALLRALQGIFAQKLYSFVAAFIDDLCVYDAFLDQHLQHIDVVFSKLKEHGFTIGP